MTNYLNIYLAVLLVAVITIFIYNFIQVVNYKWYIDYFNVNEKVCSKKNVFKYEIETYRYNIYNFLYGVNNKDFADIQNNFKNTFYLLIIITGIFYLFMSFYAMAYMTDQNNRISVLIGFLAIISLFVVGGTLIKTSYDDINHIITKDYNDIYVYMVIYKILNAIMSINDEKDVVFDYINPELKNTKTFTQELEYNIASHENLSNTSKIKSTKINAYETLDFLKYMVLDRLSPYYYKYFDNIYVKMHGGSGSSSNGDKIYIENIYKNKTYNPSQKIEATYKKINELIKNKLSKYSIINVPNNDFIKYFIDNKNIILNPYETHKYFANVKSTIDSYTNYIYIYIVLVIFLFMFFSHVLYIYLNSYIYAYLSIGIVITMIIIIFMNNYNNIIAV